MRVDSLRKIAQMLAESVVAHTNKQNVILANGGWKREEKRLDGEDWLDAFEEDKRNLCI